MFVQNQAIYQACFPLLLVTSVSWHMCQRHSGIHISLERISLAAWLSVALLASHSIFRLSTRSCVQTPALLLCIMRMAGALIVTKWRHGFDEATKLGTHGVLIALKFDAKDTRLTNWASKIPSHFDVVTLSIEKQFCYRLESFCPRLLQWYLKIRSH